MKVTRSQQITTHQAQEQSAASGIKPEAVDLFPGGKLAFTARQKLGPDLAQLVLSTVEQRRS